MTTHETAYQFSMLPEAVRKHLMETLAAMPVEQGAYDPELLYVECRQCGNPVLWEPGKTTELLLAAGVDVSNLDERCMIMSEGCPLCVEDKTGGFTLAVVRLAGLTPEEAVYMSRPGGTA